MLKNEQTPMFEETTYIHEQNGQTYPMYYLNRDGFTLLAMGFTGKKALQFKLQYIDAFNRMEEMLNPKTGLSTHATFKVTAASVLRFIYYNF